MCSSESNSESTHPDFKGLAELTDISGKTAWLTTLPASLLDDSRVSIKEPLQHDSSSGEGLCLEQKCRVLSRFWSELFWLVSPTKHQAVWFKEEFPYPKISQMVDVWVSHILVAKKFSIWEGVPWGGLFTVQFSSLWAKVTRWDNESWDLQKWLVHPEIATVEIHCWLNAFACICLFGCVVFHTCSTLIHVCWA